MPWPAAGPEHGTLGIDWAADVAPSKPPQEPNSCFRAPTGKYLPVLVDLFNGEAVSFSAQETFEQARDIACAPLRGVTTIPSTGPMKGKRIYTTPVMLRALVVDDKQRVRFDLDSRI